jgi:hypothetical protein
MRQWLADSSLKFVSTNKLEINSMRCYCAVRTEDERAYMLPGPILNVSKA